MSQQIKSGEKYVFELEVLVEELLKDRPEETLVKSRMETLGITYSEDPIERINRVLQALHPSELDFEE